MSNEEKEGVKPNIALRALKLYTVRLYLPDHEGKLEEVILPAVSGDSLFSVLFRDRAVFRRVQTCLDEGSNFIIEPNRTGEYPSWRYRINGNIKITLYEALNFL